VKIAETERTIIREITAGDAEFILDLLNQPSFIRYIGDRGVRTAAEARDFIENRYRRSYRDHGYGLYTVELKPAGTNHERLIAKPAGICGFVKRDALPAPDIGFAFLPAFEGKGYAFESAAAVMRYGRKILKFRRVLAITTPDNENSRRLLEKLGFHFEGPVNLPPGGEELKLFAADV
jgi:RimJ/RimL family protein N-acetyltransferase